MGNVVTLKPAEKNVDHFIFVCMCGCASFSLHPNGAAVCQSCQTVADHNGETWFDPTPPKAATCEAPEYLIAGNSVGDFGERSAKAKAKNADWVISGTYDGTVSTWARGVLTGEQKAWLAESVAQGLSLITVDDLQQNEA